MKFLESDLPDSIFAEYEAEELKSFSRSTTEIQWLMLVIVMLYLCIPTRSVDSDNALIVSMVGYAAFVVIFRYLGLFRKGSKWQLAFETLAMTTFITIVAWYTGKMDSPLLSLYLLVIVTCAITLGKTMTLLEIGLIGCCFLFLNYHTYSQDALLQPTFSSLMTNFSPFFFVAYVTSLLVSDIQYARKKILKYWGTDMVTGLYNMRAFNTYMKREAANSVRYFHPFSVLMIDIDDLKLVSDTYGHMAGTYLVKKIASIVKSCIRETDILARYGGDEFVILMSNTSMDEGIHLAQRISGTICKTYCEIKGEQITTTVSIGLASYPVSSNDPSDVLNKADEALYKGKNTGPNKVTHAPPLRHPTLSVA